MKRAHCAPAIFLLLYLLEGQLCCRCYFASYFIYVAVDMRKSVQEWSCVFVRVLFLPHFHLLRIQWHLYESMYAWMPLHRTSNSTAYTMLQSKKYIFWFSVPGILQIIVFFHTALHQDLIYRYLLAGTYPIQIVHGVPHHMLLKGNP